MNRNVDILVFEMFEIVCTYTMTTKNLIYYCIVHTTYRAYETTSLQPNLTIHHPTTWNSILVGITGKKRKKKDRPELRKSDQHRWHKIIIILVKKQVEFNCRYRLPIPLPLHQLEKERPAFVVPSDRHHLSNNWENESRYFFEQRYDVQQQCSRTNPACLQPDVEHIPVYYRSMYKRLETIKYSWHHFFSSTLTAAIESSESIKGYHTLRNTTHPSDFMSTMIVRWVINTCDISVR